jgi:hypothetical protein
MKFVLSALALVIILAASGALIINRKKLDTHKTESSAVKFNLKDLSEHGISLIAPSDPTFTHGKTLTVDPHSILLKNTSSRAVVGYSIKWECFDGQKETAPRNMSNDRRVFAIYGVVFLYGEEAERRPVMNRIAEVIKPDSTWLISFESPARQMSGSVEEVSAELDEASFGEVRAACPIMTVTVDGLFFDDGTFIGPDTTSFFDQVKTQMEARYEVLQGVQNDLKSGKKPSEVFSGLEQIVDREEVPNEGEMTINELRSYWRNLFVQDVLGKKNVWGPDRAIAEVEQMLGRPWVKLRKL